MFRTTRRRVLEALGIGGTAAVAGCSAADNTDPTQAETESPTESVAETTSAAQQQVDVDRVAADPTDIPEPIDRDEPKTHDVTLEVEEVTAEIEPGVTFDFMTFGGQIPGPMIRVREGDTVNLSVKNLPDNAMQHNVDLHAVYGTGGGNIATTAAPGEENGMRFKAEYPGAFIYHCAVANLDYHISSGMFGMILVEPKEGLPEVDNEYYLGQHEIYTDKGAGKEGKHGFDFEAMKNEEPTYVLFNGEKYALTPKRHGAMSAKVGETARVFMVTGGPNLPSYFHPIGNVWTKAWPNGALSGEPDKNAQTITVPPGSCVVAEMDFPVPERVKLVDHALSRVARKGLMAAIDVKGEEKPDVFDPSPETSASEDEEGPIY